MIILVTCLSSIPTSGSDSALQINDLVTLRVLGNGASGVVHLTMHMPSLTLVARKQVSVHDKSTRQQFVQELSAYSNALNDMGIRSVPHDLSLEKSLEVINANVAFVKPTIKPMSGSTLVKNLISFYGASFSEADGRVSLLLEYMDRGSLQDCIDAHGPLSESILRQIIKQITQGLYTLHSRHQVHRDVKPANILINHMGEAKLADFGISAMLSTSNGADQLCNTWCGTASYMSPERILNEPYSYPSDIWSLGLSIIVAATGLFPFATDELIDLIDNAMNEPPPALSGGFSPEFQDFVSKWYYFNAFDNVVVV